MSGFQRRYLDPHGPQPPRPPHRPWLGVTVAALGMGALLFVADWRAADAPPAPRPPAATAVLTAGPDAAVVVDVFRLGDRRIVAVVHLRGHLQGREAYEFSCVHSGPLVDTYGQAWARHGLWALIATAGCRDEPPST